jgi:hypothetical protein
VEARLQVRHLTHAVLLTTLNPQPALVLLQPPGGAPVVKGVGDGTITEPGRYVLICSVQLNVTPEQYLNHLATHPGEAPEIPGGGAPHYSKRAPTTIGSGVSGINLARIAGGVQARNCACHR